jgi:hypothetical protein
MTRVVVGITPCLLLGGLVLAWLTRPACGCTRYGYVGMRDLVHAYPGMSVGMVSVTAGGGGNRPVAGDSVRIPWGHINADPDGPKPEVVNLDALRSMARSQSTGRRARPDPTTRSR